MKERAMERIGFTMRIQPGREDEYVRRHAAVWPEMLAALKAAGCSDYSIYRRDRDLFGTMVVEDFDRPGAHQVMKEMRHGARDLRQQQRIVHAPHVDVDVARVARRHQRRARKGRLAVDHVRCQ